MAKLIVDGPNLVVQMSSLEKLGALRGDVRVPLSTVRSAEIEPHPWSAVRGIRAAGNRDPRGHSPRHQALTCRARTSPPWWAVGRRFGST